MEEGEGREEEERGGRREEGGGRREEGGGRREERWPGMVVGICVDSSEVLDVRCSFVPQ